MCDALPHSSRICELYLQFSLATHCCVHVHAYFPFSRSYRWGISIVQRSFVVKQTCSSTPVLMSCMTGHMQAAQQAANILGKPESAAAPSQQATTSTISGMSPKQLFKILTDLKAQMQSDPEKGRKVLRENLPLTKALFQAQIILGMVNPDQPSMGAPNTAQTAPPQAGAAPIKEEQTQPPANSIAPPRAFNPAADEGNQKILAAMDPKLRGACLSCFRFLPTPCVASLHGVYISFAMAQRERKAFWVYAVLYFGTRNVLKRSWLYACFEFT